MSCGLEFNSIDWTGDISNLSDLVKVGNLQKKEKEA